MFCILMATGFCMYYYFLCMNSTLDFGKRLAELRMAKGFTQKELGESIGASQRMIAYYERHVKRPPLEKLEGIARSLSLSIDELLGVKQVKKQPGAPKDAYLLRKLQQVKELPKDDQKVIVTMIDALAAKKGT
jgi:transcriptional regulator with XRE-family HTH domain